MPISPKLLKGQNVKWLCAMVGFDIFVVLALAMSPAFGTALPFEKITTRVGMATLLPVIITLLAALIPPDFKAILVYWRTTETLPGHRAFSVHAPGDPRIDLDVLRKNIGVFPADARDQNTTWYRLYKKVSDEASVVDSHKDFLLFRDLAAISLLLAMAAPPALYVMGCTVNAAIAVSCIFLGQYVVAAIAARYRGFRFVTNVLAHHSSRRVTATVPSKPKTAKSG